MEGVGMCRKTCDWALPDPPASSAFFAPQSVPDQGAHRAAPLSRFVKARHIREIACMRLFFLMFTIIGTSLAGAGVIAVLSMGLAAWQPIVAGAVLGALLGLPAAWIVAQKIRHLQ